MSKLNVYCLGGAGINIGAQWAEESNTDIFKRADFIGADFSQNNLPKNDAFKVISPEDTRGGGSVRRLNADIAPDLVERLLLEQKPGDFNIITVGSSGGSGSLLVPFLVRSFLEKEIPFVVFMIYDKSSIVFQKNTTDCLRSLDAQRKKFNLPVVLDVVENDPDKTRGQINKLAIDRLDLLSVFLTDEHEESDYRDIKHLLQYNKVLEVEPSLTCISYYGEATLKECDGNPIARFSLFESRDDVRSISLGAHYVTGIRSPNLPKPKDSTELHMVLEYDRLFNSLVEELDALTDAKSKTKSAYDRKRSADVTDGADDEGMFY